jgi:hypothetical protein
MNTGFFVTEEIPYIGTQPHTSQRSIFPCILRRVIDILGCNKFDVYKELQAAFVPPVTNFVFCYDEGLLNPPLRAQVAESLTGLKAALKIIATDSPDIEGMWALVPRCRRFTINGSRDHVCVDDHGFWNHKAHPTIFINTMLDFFLAKTNISEAERLHLLLKGFAIAIHELGHLLHHYVSLYLLCLNHIYQSLHRSTIPPQRILPKHCMLPCSPVNSLGGEKVGNALKKSLMGAGLVSVRIYPRSFLILLTPTAQTSHRIDPMGTGWSATLGSQRR